MIYRVIAVVIVRTMCFADLSDASDFTTEKIFWPVFWSIVEPSLAMICVCLPVLIPVHPIVNARQDALSIDGHDDKMHEMIKKYGFVPTRTFVWLQTAMEEFKAEERQDDEISEVVARWCGRDRAGAGGGHDLEAEVLLRPNRSASATHRW